MSNQLEMPNFGVLLRQEALIDIAVIAKFKILQIKNRIQHRALVSTRQINVEMDAHGIS